MAPPSRSIKLAETNTQNWGENSPIIASRDLFFGSGVVGVCSDIVFFVLVFEEARRTFDSSSMIPDRHDTNCAVFLEHSHFNFTDFN